MSAQVTITQLPAAGAITGTESVPIVQNGVTVQTTTAALAGSPVQTYTYLTVSQTSQLANSRYVGVTNGLVITDGGAQGLFNISTTDALLSLVNSGTGFQVKTSATAITPRSFTVSGAGLSITNGSGVSGNPNISLIGIPLNLANLSADGILTITTAGAVGAVTLQGTANQTTVTFGDALGGSPTFSLADNPVLPGIASATLPTGATADRPVSSVDGMIRFNTDSLLFEGYGNGVWAAFAAGSTGTVTSVSFTGGLISVATATTTPAFTVAGTSGGVVYFDSATTWDTSAALAANAIVLGGGAGSAPATTATGTGVVTALGVNTGTAGAFVVQNGALGTPSSGTVTNLTGTASININGTVGATTPTTGQFTTVTATTGIFGGTF